MDYKYLEDGWYTNQKPTRIEVSENYFFPDSLDVRISFSPKGKEYELTDTHIPLLYANDHMIAEFDQSGHKIGEHRATEQDQRAAFEFLGRLFPEWEKYCKGAVSTQDKLYWFDDCVDKISGEYEIKVSHKASGYCACRIKDPAIAKPKRERTVKAAAITRANAAFKSVFGGVNVEVVNNTGSSSTDDSDIPF